MNASLSGPVPHLRRKAGLAVIVVAACGHAVLAAEPAAAPPKTHHLFMGSNLSVVSKELALPVRDVRKNSFVVRGPAGDLLVDTDDRKFQLKIDDALKLTDTFATVDGLTVDRAYTPGRDPLQKFADAARTSAYMADGSERADAALRDAEGGVGFSTAAYNAAIPIAAASPGEGAAQLLAQTKGYMDSSIARADVAQQDAARALTQTGMDAFAPVSNSNRLSSDLAAEAYDAVRVTFTISSPRPLATPYAVIFIRFLETKDKPDTANVWVYAEKLPDIDEHPRKFTVFRGGFPPGYQVDSYHVHLYEGTAEIATNVSRKQVALTTDEAFQYSVIEHISGYRNQTKDPVKARPFWPEGLQARLLPDKLNRTLYVKVDKAGKALGIFEDLACRRPVADTEIAALTPELRFFPALEKGKPVPGVAAVKLGSGN